MPLPQTRLILALSLSFGGLGALAQTTGLESLGLAEADRLLLARNRDLKAARRAAAT